MSARPRHLIPFAIASLVLTLIPTSTSAAVKAGAPCTKANATTKIKGDKYVCAKNPIKNSSKLTWVWETCLTANTQYLNGQTRLAGLKTTLTTAQASLDKLISQVPATQAEATRLEGKAAEARSKQAAAVTKSNESVELAKKAGVTTSAGLAYQRNATTWSKNAALFGSAATNFERAAKSLRDKVASIDKEKAKLESAKNDIARSEADIKDSDDSRRQACSV